LRVVDAKELVAGASATNRGVIYNNLVMIRALLESKLPSGASMSRQSVEIFGNAIFIFINPIGKKCLSRFHTLW
jgi:hypothetical protein